MNTRGHEVDVDIQGVGTALAAPAPKAERQGESVRATGEKKSRDGVVKEKNGVGNHRTRGNGKSLQLEFENEDSSDIDYNSQTGSTIHMLTLFCKATAFISSIAACKFSFIRLIQT